MAHSATGTLQSFACPRQSLCDDMRLVVRAVKSRRKAGRARAGPHCANAWWVQRATFPEHDGAGEHGRLG